MTPDQERQTNGMPRASGELFLAHPGRACWAAGGMLAIVALIAIALPAGPLEIDRNWSEAMRHLESPLLTDLALVFNWLGRGLGRTMTLALIGLLLLRRRRWLALVAFAVAETLAPLLSALLKALVDRPRPPDALIHPVGASFPSGHATYAGATCVALVLLFTAPGARRRWWWALAGLGILAMAWSRTYLQVHWLTDVIAGALLGSAISLLVFALAQRHLPDASPECDSRNRPLLRSNTTGSTGLMPLLLRLLLLARVAAASFNRLLEGATPSLLLPLSKLLLPRIGQRERTVDTRAKARVADWLHPRADRWTPSGSVRNFV
jgi:membrane-associated phospholipid phosphatase